MISFLPAAAQPAARELLMTPARRIILLLGVPLSLTLLAWTCFGIISKAAQGSYTVSYSPVRVSGGLDTPLSADASVIVLPAMAGGSGS